MDILRNHVEELRWRGLLHDSMPGTEEFLLKGPASGYIGFDPTADSLHVGNMVQIMMLKHFQESGHRPIALVGGATGMVGDPSGKSSERNLLDEELLRHNQECVGKQLARFIDFDSTTRPAELVNNYDWFKDMGFLRFIREVGKHIPVGYMLAKDSVKNRMETGISFTEFTYQLVQGYDYYWLYKNKGCKLQMGGSDQWGNITTGTELIRRMDGGEAFALTTPLLTKADGSKFGKSEGGNIWLDKSRTTAFDFFQFWLRQSDADAARFVKIFTTWPQEECESLITEHGKAEHLRNLQKKLAYVITATVHGSAAADLVVRESDRVYLGLQTGSFSDWSEETWNVASGSTASADLNEIVPLPMLVTELVTGATGSTIYKSKAEAKRAIQEGALKINGQSVTLETRITDADFFHKRFLLVNKAKNKPVFVRRRPKH